MLVKLLIATAVCFFSVTAFTQHSKEIYAAVAQQESQGETPIPTLKERFQEIDGTFEVIYSISDYKILHTEDLYQTIQGERLPDQDVTIEWDGYTTIVIHPIKTKVGQY